MRLVTRPQWNARSPKSVTRLSSPAGSTLHWEGPHMGTFSHESCAPKVRGIQNFHMDSRGWADIAYSAIVCPHGWTFEGRWLGVRTAANGTNAGNAAHYAICYLGGEGDPFTDAAKLEFNEVVAYLDANGAGSEWKGHRDWKSTACPGDTIYSWVKQGHPYTAPAPYTPQSDPTPTEHAVAFTAYADGVWTFDATGGVFTEGSLPFYGSLASTRLNAPIVWGEGLPTKDGYVMVAADGGIFSFGAAKVVQPYQNLFSEYAQGLRHIEAAQRTDSGLILLSNLGERYALA